MPFISVLTPEHTGTHVKHRDKHGNHVPVTILEKHGYPGMDTDWLEHDQVALIQFDDGRVQITHCTNLCTDPRRSKPTMALSYYERFYGHVCDKLEENFQLTRSDAQGLADCYESIVRKAFEQGGPPELTAAAIDIESRHQGAL